MIMYGKIIPETPRFAVGSEVQINSLLWCINECNSCTGIVEVGPYFTIEMREYCGKVTKVVEHDEFTHTYELAIDGGKNRWSEEMFKKK